jgi:hypothetical protein
MRREAILAYRLLRLNVPVNSKGRAIENLQLTYAIRLKKLERRKPPPSVNSPSKPIRERLLAVLGRAATGATTGGGTTAATSAGGGGSTTVAVSTVSPAGGNCLDGRRG